MNKQLPFFVYGTLLPGHANFDRIFHGHDIKHEAALLPGHALLADAGSFYPYMVDLMNVPAHGRTVRHPVVVKGAILRFTPSKHCSYDDILGDLDRLEGVPHHYQRVERLVVRGDGAEEVVWCYLLSKADTEERFVSPFCEFSSWVEHVKKYTPYRIKE